MVGSQKLYRFATEPVCSHHLSVPICNGLPPPALFDTYDHGFPETDFLAGVPIQQRFRRKLCQIVTNANVELGHNSQSAHTSIGAAATKSIINLNVWQQDQMANACPSQQGRYLGLALGTS